MEYRKLGRTGLDVSAISLGMEHLQSPPATDVVDTVHRALDQGVNYTDIMIWKPAFQEVLGEALRGRRDEVILAGHLGVAHKDGQYRRTRDIPECEQLFQDLLARVGTDHVDVLFLSNVDEPDDYDGVMRPGGVLDLALRYRAEGKARYLALSGHEPATCVRAIESGKIDVLMFPINVAKDADPAAREIARLCASRDIGLVGMKPFNGGELFQREQEISAIKCIHYSLAQPGLSTCLMGVKNRSQLEANLAYLDATDEERDYTSLVDQFQEGVEGICVYCNHCHPCTVGIEIAEVNRLVASAGQGMSAGLQAAYDALEVPASECIECGDCMERCPFDVDIIAGMQRAVEVFG
jgi:predicted aldo/keto reductase-like oxidoreductase